MVEIDEVLDAQTIDIGIVSDALRSEIPAEIEAVGTNQLGKLIGGNVVLQIELSILAILLQQWPDVAANG